MNNALKTSVRFLLGTADVAELLLEKGAIVDFQDNDGDSAKVNLSNYIDVTPMHLAAENGKS